MIIHNVPKGVYVLQFNDNFALTAIECNDNNDGTFNYIFDFANNDDERLVAYKSATMKYEIDVELELDLLQYLNTSRITALYLKYSNNVCFNDNSYLEIFGYEYNDAIGKFIHETNKHSLLKAHEYGHILSQSHLSTFVAIFEYFKNNCTILK